MSKNSNYGQGHRDGRIDSPANVPPNQRGTMHGHDVKNKIDRYSKSPKETKEAGLGGTQAGSNKSIVS